MTTQGDRIQGILGRLDNVRSTSDGWKASCPVPGHGRGRGDKNPSLSIAQGDDEEPVMHCHAGCSYQEIIDALGLEGGLPQSTEDDVTEKYDYHDANGDLLFQVVRKPGKQFFQRRPDGYGGWDWGRGNVDPLPYHLPEVLDAARVFIGEGEKDVETLREHDLIATCNPGGAGNWRDDFSQHFEGKDVVILPDHDDAGREHAQDVAGSLEDVAASVRIVELPGLEEGDDVSDWMQASGTVEELLELVENTEKYGAKDWPDPVLPTQPAPAQDFPLSVLPMPARAYVEEKAKAVGTTETLVAPFVLGTLAAGIGSSVELDIKSEWKQAANHYQLCVTPSGVGKSPAMEGATQPIVEQHRRLQEENERRKEKYERAKNQDTDQVPKPPPQKRAFVNDATTEALGEDLGESPRGVVQIMDEASAWTRGMNKYREGDDREFYLRAWNRDAIETSRKTETEISVDRPHLTVIGAMVPTSLQHLTPPGENEEDGFLPRILFVCPDVEQTGMTFTEVSQEIQREYRKFVERLYHIVPTEKPEYDPFAGLVGEWEPRRISLSPDARNRVQQWFNETMLPRQKQADDPIIQSFISKLQNHVWRFALILQVAHDVHEGEGHHSVDPVNAERAIKLSEFFLSHFERTLAEIQLQAKEGDRDLKRYVLRRVKEKLEQLESDSVPYLEIQQATKDKADIEDSKHLQRLLRELENDHCVRINGSPGHGGKRAAVRVNPKLDTPESDSSYSSYSQTEEESTPNWSNWSENQGGPSKSKPVSAASEAEGDLW